MYRKFNLILYIYVYISIKIFSHQFWRTLLGFVGELEPSVSTNVTQLDTDST